MASTRSIHFPVPAPAGESARPRAGIVEAYSGALRAVETARELLRRLVISDGRHGDLQAALSAARELERHLAVLIEGEEG
jgi:hypothetical protein